MTTATAGVATLHDAGTRQELIARAAKLSNDSVRQWGRMSADQMLWHVNEALRMATGEIQPRPKHTLTTRTLLKWVAFNMPWPKGKAGTAPELKAQGSYDIEVERARFASLLQQVGGRQEAGKWPAHPMFGPLTGTEWGRLGYLHINHHFHQFGL